MPGKGKEGWVKKERRERGEEWEETMCKEKKGQVKGVQPVPSPWLVAETIRIRRAEGCGLPDGRS